MSQIPQLKRLPKRKPKSKLSHIEQAAELVRKEIDNLIDSTSTGVLRRLERIASGLDDVEASL